MKKAIKLMKVNWITAWMVLIVISVVSFVGYAEYIENQNRMKRVAANVAEAGKLFTSDYLTTSSSAPYKVQFAENVTSCMIPVKIRNYNSADVTAFYTHDLPYDVTFQLVKENGSIVTPEELDDYRIQVKKSTEDAYTQFSTTGSVQEITVTEDSGTEYTYTVTASYSAQDGYTITYQGILFEGDSRFEHMFQLDFQKEIMTNEKNLFIKMSATPDSSIRDEVDELSGILGVTEVQPTLTQGWKGGFVDNSAHLDYDAYNYVISGSGEDTLRFSWNADKLEVNPFFLDEFDDDIETGYPKTESRDGVTWKTIYLHVNSNDTYTLTKDDNDEDVLTLTRNGINRYDIQVYMKGIEETDYSTWDMIKGYVEFQSGATVPTA